MGGGGATAGDTESDTADELCTATAEARVSEQQEAESPAQAPLPASVTEEHASAEMEHPIAVDRAQGPRMPGGAAVSTSAGDGSAAEMAADGGADGRRRCGEADAAEGATHKNPRSVCPHQRIRNGPGMVEEGWEGVWMFGWVCACHDCKLYFKPHTHTHTHTYTHTHTHLHTGGSYPCARVVPPSGQAVRDDLKAAEDGDEAEDACTTGAVASSVALSHLQQVHAEQDTLDADASSSTDSTFEKLQSEARAAHAVLEGPNTSFAAAKAILVCSLNHCARECVCMWVCAQLSMCMRASGET